MSLKIGTKVKVIATDSKVCTVFRIDKINGVYWYKLEYNGYIVPNIFQGVQLEVVE